MQHDKAVAQERARLREEVVRLHKENKRTEKWSDDYYHALADVLALLRD